MKTLSELLGKIVFLSFSETNMEKISINHLLDILELGCDVWSCGTHPTTKRREITIALRMLEQKQKY
jgi:hypothetical protein